MDGYNKHKDSMFWIRRNDRDILILLNKCVDELLAIPVEKLRGTEAQLENLRGLYYMDVAIRSTLHTRSLNQKMNPNLQAYVDVVRDELAYAMEVEIPKSEGWTEVPIEDLLLRIIARISAIFIVGVPLCRNEEWLRTSRDLGVNVFTTVLILRELPPFLRPLHPIIARCLPSWHRMQANFSISKRLIAPVLEQHSSKKTSGKNNDDGPASPLLTWMADNGSNDLERDPVNLAHHTMFLGLRSIHTTASQAIHATLDLTVRPKVLESLRDEFRKVITTDGGWGEPNLLELWKLDSFMSESQRIDPPSLSKTNPCIFQNSNCPRTAVFHRLAMEPLTLSDGTYLPEGTFITVAAASTLLDPEITPDPETFDAFRTY
ncbi:hypothetical protein ABVK25_004148 [Lepraria finkii]|uniref:Cytochrome P450 n=1 Tax=Lepraria finkii TaxID=1340010 RepID=A0ABR4BBZ0_9LECA